VHATVYSVFRLAGNTRENGIEVQNSDVNMKEQEETYEKQDIRRMDKCCDADLPSREAIKLEHEVDCLKIELEAEDKEILQLQDEVSNLRSDNANLRSSVDEVCDAIQAMRLDKNTSSKDSDKVKFYTGLASFTLLMHVFKLVSEFMDVSPRCALSSFQQFLIVFMRLRLNLTEQDLAYRFGVH